MKRYIFFSFIILLIILCVREPVIIDNNPKPQKALPVTYENFESSIPENGVALIEFYSENCILCQQLGWIIDSLYINFNSKAFIGASSIEKDSLYKRFYIDRVPTYIFFKNREEIKKYIFSESKPEIYDTLSNFIKKLIKDTSSIIDTSVSTEDSTIDTLQKEYYTLLDSLNFDSLILNNKKIAMVLFINSKGIPCIHMDSVVKTILPQFKNRVFIGKVEAWEQNSLSSKYSIQLVPQLLFFKKGIELTELRIIGIISGDSLSNILEKLIKETGDEYILKLNKSNFDSIVKTENSVVMVEFFSPTCGACINMENKVAELALKYSEIATICKVNVTEEDSLRKALNVTAWPTFIFFKNGKEVERHIGSTTLETLTDKLNKILDIP